MSLRAIWILNHSGSDGGKLLFSRTFPTVERRAIAVEGAYYVPVPPHHQMAGLLKTQLGIKSTEFIDVRDSCRATNEKPIYHIQTSVGQLWPVLVIEQHGLLFCCLSLVEQGAHSKPPLLDVSGISVGFTLLLALADFLGPYHKITDESSPRINELALLLNQAAPFGTPCNTNINILKTLVFGNAPVASERAAWKPFLYKGKTQVRLELTEQIRAIQYDKPSVPDVWDVFGTVVCKADIEGAMSELSVTLAQESDKMAVPLEGLIVHPCVVCHENTETGNRFRTSVVGGVTSPREGRTGSATPSSRRSSVSSISSLHHSTLAGTTFRLTPPSETFTLCHYTANLTELPIKGFYQMKGEETVEILIQLKLSERVKNNFEICDVHIPFYHRGCISHYDLSTSTYGSVAYGRDKKSLIWTIGQKFPKKLEVSLKATVHFTEYKINNRDDKFCVGQNTYIRLLFRILDFTQTGCYIEPKSVLTVPPSKFKASTGREYVAAEYMIWNSHGDVLASYSPQ